MVELAGMGTWSASDQRPAFAAADLLALAARIRDTTHIVHDPDSARIGLARGGHTGTRQNGAPGYTLLASLPPLFPEWLGDRTFAEVHDVRFPYVTGAMARGIASVELVVAVAEMGALAFFGAAGLAPDEVEAAMVALADRLGPRNRSWGTNLIHSPDDPDLEERLVDIYLQRDVRRVSAAAYLQLTPAVVRYASTGLRRDPAGRIVRRNHLFAKISRPEVARRFMAPPPAEMLAALRERGTLSGEEIALAAQLPLAEDVTVEADSAGHTDRQTLGALFPTVQRLRDELQVAHGYPRPIRLGAAGGLGTPAAVASAFALGAAYVLTGSVNQACVESGLHEDGKALLGQAQLDDVVMAPAADMFELGAEVQVLRRGTMFGVRARKLRDLFRTHASVDELPVETRSWLEREIWRQPLAEVWDGTRAYWQARDPGQLERAEREPRHQLALLLRAYLGQSSRWATTGETSRRLDYQIWCGPAQGAFNAWVRGSFLEPLENRRVVEVARNLLEGAALLGSPLAKRSVITK